MGKKGFKRFQVHSHLKNNRLLSGKTVSPSRHGEHGADLEPITLILNPFWIQILPISAILAKILYFGLKNWVTVHDSCFLNFPILEFPESWILRFLNFSDWCLCIIDLYSQNCFTIVNSERGYLVLKNIKF